MKKNHLATFVFMFLEVLICNAAGETRNNPVAVSPGSETEVVTVWQSCPTFSWSAVDQATSYQLAIFESPDGKIAPYESMVIVATPVVSKQIAGPALSWTLPSDEKLKTGSQYAWYVQALEAYGNALGSWSDGRVFKVEQELRFVGIEQKLGEILKSYGVSDETASNILNDLTSVVKEVEVRNGGSDVGSKNTPGVSRIQGTEGDSKTLYGLHAGESITTGVDNTFLGSWAGSDTTSGMQNTFVGYGAGVVNTEGRDNTFLGSGAGYKNTTGTSNTFIGTDSGVYNTTANGNTFVGYYSGQSNTTGQSNTFIGSGAGSFNTTGIANTFLGVYAGNSNTTATGNTFIGYYTGWSNTTGYDNTFIGFNAGNSNITGKKNTLLGTDAGVYNTAGEGNTFLGYNAGKNEIGSNKLYIANSDTSTPLIYGEFDNSLLKINGNLRLTGYLSLDNGATQINSTEINLLHGKTSVSTGSIDNDKLVTKGYVDENDDVGGGLTGDDMSDTYICKWDDSNTRLVNSLISESSGVIKIDGKLGIGTSTPAYPIEVDTTSINSCILVKRTDGAANYINATDAYANFGSTTNHPLRLVVNGAWKMRLNQDGSLSMSNGASLTTGGVWTNASSRALKENIENLSTDEAVNALAKLNPVKYNYKVDKTDKHVGFIAEDVPELVASADRKGLSPMDVTAVLTKVVQELQRENQEQQNLIQEQQKVNQEYRKIISDLQERMAKIEKN